MTCRVCGELVRWHILLGEAISPADWHSITEGFLKPSDIVDDRGRIARSGRKMAARRAATRIRFA